MKGRQRPRWGRLARTAALSPPVWGQPAPSAPLVASGPPGVAPRWSPEGETNASSAHSTRLPGDLQALYGGYRAGTARGGGTCPTQGAAL